MKDTGKINIHGKEYETVASRVQRFRQEHGDKYAIITEIITADDERVVMKASIMLPAQLSQEDGSVRLAMIATGHAEERRDSSSINRTSALEVAETSAIGRALAAFGMAGTEFASADEVAQAIGQRSAPTPAKRPDVGTTATKAPAASAGRKLVTEAQVKLLLARARDASGLTDRQGIYDWFLEKVGVMPNEVLMAEVDSVLKVITPDADPDDRKGEE